MYFDNLGLVLNEDRLGNINYFPWRHVNGIYDWIVNQNKKYNEYPFYLFTREQVGFILANYEDYFK